MNVLGLVTARGGSKGLPGKNIRELNGKPLIAWSIEAAKTSGVVARVAVSTDDEQIAQVAAEWGAEVPFLRPADISGDASPHILAVEHALSWMLSHEAYAPDYVLLLQPTSPLRSPEDIQAAVRLAEEKGAAAVMSVTPARKHPNKMFVLHENGELGRFLPPTGEYLRRQDLVTVFEENGAIYLNRCKDLLACRTFQPPGTIPYVMPHERSIDIDDLFDFYLAEAIMKYRAGA